MRADAVMNGCRETVSYPAKFASLSRVLNFCQSSSSQNRHQRPMPPDSEHAKTDMTIAQNGLTMENAIGTKHS